MASAPRRRASEVQNGDRERGRRNAAILLQLKAASSRSDAPHGRPRATSLMAEGAVTTAAGFAPNLSQAIVTGQPRLPHLRARPLREGRPCASLCRAMLRMDASRAQPRSHDPGSEESDPRAGVRNGSVRRLTRELLPAPAKDRSSLPRPL
jgi:hypothetical protein